MSSERMGSGHDPRYEGIYQRGGGAEAPSRVASSEPPAPALPPGPDPTVEPPAIREVTPVAPARQVGIVARNPYDRWIWIVAGVLVASGMFFLLAPLIFEQQYREAYTSGQMGPSFITPWYSNTIIAAPVLLLLGVATAIGQLFLLSIRRTLTTR